MADRNTPSAFDAAFAELDAALIDLDGDGRPDVAVPQQIPQRLVPKGGNALMPGFEMLPSQAPQQGNALLRSPMAQAQDAATRNELPPPAPPPAGGFPQPPPEPQRYGLPKLLHDTFGGTGNALMNYGRRVYEDVASDPLGAITSMGAWNPVGAIASGNASSVGYLVDPVIRTMGRNALREFTPAGRAKNAADEAHSVNVWTQEQRAAREAHPDVLMSRQPHWELQPNVKGPDGRYRFGKLPDDVRAARQRGIELRRREQSATDRAKKYNEGSN
jgi:hypothetical protein